MSWNETLSGGAIYILRDNSTALKSNSYFIYVLLDYRGDLFYGGGTSEGPEVTLEGVTDFTLTESVRPRKLLKFIFAELR